MKVESIYQSDLNTYWNYKRKSEDKRKKEKCKVYNEIENGIGNKGKYIDWRV